MEATREVISVTSKAADKVRSLAQREGKADACLRLRVTAGGCSGFSYRLSFEESPADGDRVVEGHGVRVLVDPMSAPIVQGSTLDLDENLLGGGLKVVNPNAVPE